jgi:hypothetical protein
VGVHACGLASGRRRDCGNGTGQFAEKLSFQIVVSLQVKGQGLGFRVHFLGDSEENTGVEKP